MTNILPDRLSPQEIQALFPAGPKPVDAKTFEIGLVLGGTVSAGAYTAGVLDFLVEALDAWEEAKAKDPEVPQHKIVLKVVAGASGGAVCGATLARIAQHKIPPVRPGSGEADQDANPFYKVWVDLLNIGGMLSIVPPAETFDDSLCNPQPIDTATAYVRDFASPTPAVRPWMANPLTVFMTVTNLRGIPYKVNFQDPNLNLAMVDHADFGRFWVQTGPNPVRGPRPDEFSVDTTPGDYTDWATFANYARASGAFPFGFPHRLLFPPLKHYNYRVAALPGDAGQAGEVKQLVPDWGSMAGDQYEKYESLVVDGGATNNQPIELARTELTGWLSRLPRDGNTANRAVILIDPFNSPPDVAPKDVQSLAGLLGPLAGGLKDQARYGTQDLTLAAESSVFSRFMITARRPMAAGGGEWIGSDAICSSGMSAFLGFMSEDYRRHDYFLGRANCQAFLRDVFAVPESNPVVSGWTAAQGAAHGFKKGNIRYRRLIPLIGTAADPQANIPWPAGKFIPAALQGAVKARVNAVLSNAQSSLKVGFLGDVYLKLGHDAAVGMVATMIMTAITAEVAKLDNRK